MREKGKKRILVLLFFMLFSIAVMLPKENVKAVTSGFWTDRGNFTDRWYDAATGLDYQGNTGTEGDPYVISNEKDLAALSYYSNLNPSAGGSNFSGKYIEFDVYGIDLSNYEWTGIGSSYPFYGNIIGNDVNIYNVLIGGCGQSQDYTYVGFFGSSYGQVADVNLYKINYVADFSTYVGGFAAIAGGKMKSCTVEGKIYAAEAPLKVLGGFIGEGMEIETVKMCDADVYIYVKNISSVPDIAGFMARGKGYFKNCYSINNINVVKSIVLNVGGFIGDGNAGTKVVGSKVSKAIQITEDCNITNVGGFAGSNLGSAEYCNSYIKIQSSKSFIAFVGGFIGASLVNDAFYQCDVRNVIQLDETTCKAVGGFFGFAARISQSECNAEGTVFVELCGYAGGFGGLAERCELGYNSAKEDVTAKNAEAGYGCAGGFIGFCCDSCVKLCNEQGTVNVGNGFNVGGFYGWVARGTTIITYTITDIYSGNNCRAGGYAGYYDGEMIGDSYCTGIVSANGSSLVGGAIGYTSGNDQIRSLFWNKDKQQIVNGVIRTNNVAFGNGNSSPNVTGVSDGDMRGRVFVDMLNNTGFYSNWTNDYLGGYPYYLD
ncbi:hypothetical protein [Anaeromicropila populeti]|uniref:The GLUG motif-containing protein n=1 Tax=Anaeromicropila populeti TaxID=37658 RepID=A0A1I6LKF8_9FIRM|nr:hypothetical protein [Anaeromicropila populeti]SFS03861.1 hypothetical protein SAMN05661086_03349 [Anaeromicropila populeti]